MGIKNDSFADFPEPRPRSLPVYTDQAGNEVDLEAEYASELAADDVPDEPSPDIDLLPDEDWQALKNTAEGRRARAALAQRKSALDRAMAERQSFGEQFAALQAKVDMLSNNGAQQKASPYGDAGDEEIKNWINNAKLLRQRAASEPDNAALQAEAAKVNDTVIEELREELQERKLNRLLEDRLAPLAAKSEEAAVEAMVARQLAAAGVSTDALTNEGNALRQAAMARAQKVASALGVRNSDSKAKAVAITLSMLMEHELAQTRNRAGRGLDARVRRQLDIEGASRRAAANVSVGSGGKSVHSEVAKMRKIAAFVQQIS